MAYTYRPHHVELFSEMPDEEITWRTTNSTDPNSLLQKRWSTVRSLKHIANPATGDLRDRTWALICTDLQVTNLPEVITGVQLNLNTNRNGRVFDEIIQLTYQGNLIGINNINYQVDSEGHLSPLQNESVYGGLENLWEADITEDMVRAPSFGVFLKFQSHPFYPHNCGMLVDSVSITFY